MQGRNLPTHITILRAEYYNDLQFLLDTLARLGLELRSFPGKAFFPISFLSCSSFCWYLSLSHLYSRMSASDLLAQSISAFSICEEP